MKNLITVLALCVPLVAQDVVPDQEEKQDKKNVEQREHRKSFGKRVWMGVQDAEWKKFDAAHRRAHAKHYNDYNVERGEHKKHKRSWVRKAVGIVVIGGIGYYIGVNDRKHYRKGGQKRWPDRPGK